MSKVIGTLLIGVVASLAAAYVYDEAVKGTLKGRKPDAPPPAQPAKPAKIQLYLFTATWCGPCQALHRQMRDPTVQKALERFNLVETADQAKGREYGVTGLPTFVAIASAGPTKKVGYQTAAQLVEWLNSLR